MDYKEVVEAAIKRWDIFRTILGGILLFTAGYLWVNYFLPIKDNFTEFLLGHITYYITLLGMVLLFVFGFWSFLTGMSQMESVYDIERTKIQLNHLKQLKELNEMELGPVKLDKKTKEKFQKYIKKELKEAIEYFE